MREYDVREKVEGGYRHSCRFFPVQQLQSCLKRARWSQRLSSSRRSGTYGTFLPRCPPRSFTNTFYAPNVCRALEATAMSPFTDSFGSLPFVLVSVICDLTGKLLYKYNSKQYVSTNNPSIHPSVHPSIRPSVHPSAVSAGGECTPVCAPSAPGTAGGQLGVHLVPASRARGGGSGRAVAAGHLCQVPIGAQMLPGSAATLGRDPSAIALTLSGPPVPRCRAFFSFSFVLMTERNHRIA